METRTPIKEKISDARGMAADNDLTTRLRQITAAYKKGQFGDRLKEAAKSLHSILADTEATDTAEYWKARSLIYELNDIYHFDPSIGESLLTTGKDIEDELHTLSVSSKRCANLTIEERTLAREKVIYCACFGNELKRSGNTEESRRVFEWLYDFTVNRLRLKDEFPCFATQAILTYQLGSIYRILEQHGHSEDMYTQTLTLLYERSRSRGSEDFADHLFVLRKQAMAIGIGFGWVNLTRGFLRRAENAITTARSLLAGSTDPIVPFYIELLYGTIQRCRAGSDREQLGAAIKTLRKARRAFWRQKHSRLLARACWELSLARNLTGQFRLAQKHVDVVAAYATQTNHPKWMTNVRILQSRILRTQGNCEDALAEAELAVLKAHGCTSVLPSVDACITRGEARFCIAEKSGHPETYDTARADFETALSLSLKWKRGQQDTSLPVNPKIVAVCELRIAQCFARAGDEARARRHLANWDVLRPSVEHEWVRELGARVVSETEDLSKSFMISAVDHSSWNYAVSVTKLRQWLLTQALRHTKRNYSEAAKLIGVKRATLYQWQDDSRLKSKRARIGVSSSESKPRS